LGIKALIFPKGIDIPLKGIVPASWMPLVVEEENINRVPYEICVLKALREQLRCREIWVVGSRRYRNPEDDLPLDFEENKAAYFEVLGIPMDAKTFTTSLGVIKQLGEILHRILSNDRHHKTYKKYFTSHFIVPVAPIFLEA